MSEVVHDFDDVFRDGNTRYRARVVAASYQGTTWQGWIEFLPTTGGGAPPYRTVRETVQPDRDAVVYWAQGLEPLYLDGAFERACRSAKVIAPA